MGLGLLLLLLLLWLEPLQWSGKRRYCGASHAWRPAAASLLRARVWCGGVFGRMDGLTTHNTLSDDCWQAGIRSSSSSSSSSSIDGVSWWWWWSHQRVCNGRGSQQPFPVPSNPLETPHTHTTTITPTTTVTTAADGRPIWGLAPLCRRRFLGYYYDESCHHQDKDVWGQRRLPQAPHHPGAHVYVLWWAMEGNVWGRMYTLLPRVGPRLIDQALCFLFYAGRHT
jgi:hypothetical protein